MGRLARTAPIRATAVAAALTVGLTLVPTGSASGSAGPTSHPRALAQGPFFASPGSGTHVQRVVAMIDGAPARSRIRVTTMSFTSGTFASALVRAAARGVRVRVLTAGMARDDQAFLDTRSGFARHRSSRSRIKAVKLSARGRNVVGGKKTVFHQKSFTFSRTLGRRDVTVISSANLTDEARDNQWTDSYAFVDNSAIFGEMNRVFAQQWADRPLRRPFRQFTPAGGSAQLTFGPWNSASMPDPVLRRIRSVPAASSTTIRVANSSWHGPRGLRLARALARKANAGAKVFVLVGRPFGRDVRRALRRAGVTFLRGHVPGAQYHHVKFMTARFVRNGRTMTRVWAGSENWSDSSRFSDELVYRVSAGSTHGAYVRFFDRIHRQAIALSGRRG